MENSRAVQNIEVQLDTQEAQISANTLAETLEELARSLETIAQWDMRGIVLDMAEMDATLNRIATLLGDKLDGKSWFFLL